MLMLINRGKHPRSLPRREKQLSSKVIVQLMGTTIFINKVGNLRLKSVAHFSAFLFIFYFIYFFKKKKKKKIIFESHLCSLYLH